MQRSWWLAAVLLVVAIGLVGGVYEGALAAMRLDMPHWVILLLAVAVPVVLGRAADRVWRQLK
ncbi:MAG: hypothetical protein IIZ38_01370 [Sphingomonas sp.]|uniref:hypothetical protein n=1 Tax=unclassified Sphingomonas TaxID=196159 RepID=UPI002457E51C|nr:MULTISPECIES: hypothetical protein [unclassified Sphingomonas]MBQ1496942.1 hypothetical protein [Sphingomonas sp.]MDH4744001.1 hypothetical protein [Sphingomonas sp. CBMAI 2297]